MKRFLVLTMAVILVFTLTSCGNKDYQIDSQEWIMTTIQNTKDGTIIACGSDSTNVNDNAEKIEMTCKAEKGNITINDLTNEKVYSGEYTLNIESPDSTIYKISIGESEGMAVVSYTQYDDDSQVNTLILSLEDYALSFFEKNN